MWAGTHEYLKAQSTSIIYSSQACANKNSGPCAAFSTENYFFGNELIGVLFTKHKILVIEH